MASITSEILAKVIRGVKPLITSLHLEQQRAGQAMLSRVKTLPRGMRIKHADDCPLNAEWILPNCAPEGKTLLYMHGGAYRTGDLVASRGLIAYICKACSLRALSFEYRLAPEHPFPAALEDAVEAYRWLLREGYAAEDIALLGDSAGGGLILSTVLRLESEGLPLPACLMCISPWADLTETSESHAMLEEEDPLVDTGYLLRAALEYSGGESLFNPYISPLFAQFYSHFPPTLIHVGTREVLFDDAVRLEEKLREAGVDVRLEVFSGMWHVWHAFNVPESNDALERINGFLREKLHLPACEAVVSKRNAPAKPGPGEGGKPFAG
jgi:monoterpene epsilon-lactone hydrolase